MDEKSRTSASKFLSYVLRHNPEEVGISLTPDGWINVDTLLQACSKNGRPLTRAELEEVVSTSSKRRFAWSRDGSSIRANQGHSTSVELGYEPIEPPEVLFHGTIAIHLPSIRANGLLRMKRHHVHLSQDIETAQSVAARKGKSIILRIEARAMHLAGYCFFVTPNRVWLTDTVPSCFITGLDGE